MLLEVIHGNIFLLVILFMMFLPFYSKYVFSLQILLHMINCPYGTYNYFLLVKVLYLRKVFHFYLLNSKFDGRIVAVGF